MRVSAATKAATRERILDVVQQLFHEKGYDATTTRDIAERAAIATGTLFNYFATKEAIVTALASEALDKAGKAFTEALDDACSLDEALFAHIAAGLRQLRPYRKYLAPLLEGPLGPLALNRKNDIGQALRVQHLETVTSIFARHNRAPDLTPMALQLYWTLYTGVLAYWANDSSPKQEDTLALLDQVLNMFLGWLATQNRPTKSRASKR